MIQNPAERSAAQERVSHGSQKHSSFNLRKTLPGPSLLDVYLDWEPSNPAVCCRPFQADASKPPLPASFRRIALARSGRLRESLHLRLPLRLLLDGLQLCVNGE